MRGFASYLLAGILVVLAMDMVAPPVGLGLSVSAWPAAEPMVQLVDRTGKSDRLRASTTVGKQQEPVTLPAVLIGCDPAFSPLSASAQSNFSGRCVAEITGVRAIPG
jgi:hypothetical protein